ncbi:MAG: sialidase family protein [Ignavibacteria bacterium]|nr:exo-alpha-sialidase [Ignavibacteria bacterium]MBK9406369.1 exo-alpha-sialidase [Ignavibacteria bacterium]
MKKVFSLFFFSVLGLFLFMGQKSINKPEKWNIDPQQTGIYDPNVISTAPLPQEYDYFNPNNTTRYISSPSGVYAVNPNFRILPRAGSYQSEVIICRHPLNPLIMFGSSNAINNTGTLFISEGVYVTTNGGVNWFGSDTLQGAPIGNHGGDPGPTIDKNGVIIMSHLGYSTSGMFANYSSNNGATWSSTYTIASGSQDKNFATTDDAPSSPYYGRSYVVWSLFSVSNPPIAISYTANGGVSWSAAAQINTSVAGHYSQGCDARVGPNGEVYVVWAAPNTAAANVEDFAGFAKSVNGGVTWTVTNNAYDMNGIRGSFPTKNNIRTNGFTRIDVDRSGGPRNGWIYVVASEKNLAPAGSDPDVVLHKSTDGGVSWSAGVRVNQDALNNGKYQFFPAIRVDEIGGVNIVYYDDRNTASDSSEIYMSRSIDGGTTFTDLLVSDHRFQPKTISVSGLATGYMGDYIGVTSGNGKIWPLWMDDKSGISQAWTTSIDLGPGITHTPLPNTEQLSGNYAVNCVITPSGSGINPSLTKLLWSRNNVAITDSLLMTNSGGNNWTANIPANGAAATYRYYIKTTDSLNKTSVSPAGAPASLNLFVAQTDNTKPVIVHTQLGNQPKPNWPSTVTATVTDNVGLDSSWVKWYKNSPAPIKQFKLINTTGSTFSAAFNSLNSDVVVGDFIFYRIFAQDNSVSHNMDSTSMYSFQIIDQILCEDFSSATFVPTNWSLEYTGTLYWTRESVSGYGSGTGSSKFNFWNATSGTTQSMISLTFGSSVAGDSLKFDNAYAPYTDGSTDSLEILTSSNGGTTFISLVRLWGNNTTGNLNTTAASSTLFTPTAAQWATKKYSLPVGTNKVKFRARSGFGNNLFLDNICKINAVVSPSTSAISFAAQGYHNTITNTLNMRDTARFYLRNAFSPFSIVDSAKTVIDSVTYTGTVTFSNAQTGIYYVVIKGRNMLETWSKSGGEVYTRGTPFTYNFTTAITQAYNSNIKLVGSKYCNYNGDLDQDGIIDVSDVSLVDNASFNGLTGYVTEDVTGDYFVDVSDVSIVDNNSFSGVQVAAPPGAVIISEQSDSQNTSGNNSVSKNPSEGKNSDTGKKEIITRENNTGKGNPVKNKDLKK